MSDRFFRQNFSFALLPHNPDKLTGDCSRLFLQNFGLVTVASDERRSPPSTFERSPLDPSAPSKSREVAETSAAPCIKSESPRLALLKPAQATMKVERVAPNRTVGDRPRLLLIHFESGLQIPEPFTQQECEVIRNVIQCWHWMVDLKSREPSGRAYLLNLLEEICDQPAIFGGVAS
ncbi:hypothetical protein [Trichocoleus sp. DQ-U1]|uniref:hypothetical protein n=1 Tax=Trichocoleus sp. DQ-U1 TaxID=2933926 RepID=UPI00329819B5